MKVLAYKGRHKGDGVKAFLGWLVIRIAQAFYRWGHITHTEVLVGGDCNAADIGSATLVDGNKVRVKKRVLLNPDHWVVIDIPDTIDRNTLASLRWFMAHEDEKYDLFGAIGAVLYGVINMAQRWFCNEACGASMGQSKPHRYPPAGFIAWCLTLPDARVCTAEFFKDSTWAAAAAHESIQPTSGGPTP